LSAMFSGGLFELLAWVGFTRRYMLKMLTQ